MIPEKQRQIIKLLEEAPDQTLKKAEIVSQFSHWYYHNAGKYIGEILFRMTRSGYLSKPKSGYYKLNPPEVIRKHRLTGGEMERNPNQAEIFFFE